MRINLAYFCQNLDCENYNKLCINYYNSKKCLSCLHKLNLFCTYCEKMYSSAAKHECNKNYRLYYNYYAKHNTSVDNNSKIFCVPESDFYFMNDFLFEKYLLILYPSQDM